MKRTASLILSAIIIISAGIGAKASDKNDWKQKMMSEKIAFLTVELDLTPEEAQAFWPVYNMASTELDNTMQEIFRTHKALAKAIDDNRPKAEISSLLDRYLAAQQKHRETEGAMAEKYKKVLPVEKVAKLYISEEKFRRQCIHRMHGKQQGQQKTPQNSK
ncbi:MAG: hypothetical protein K2G18_01390 [Bacteroidales bacterium]|nr:hypothetical protein [Bacteroidales bacterium]